MTSKLGAEFEKKILEAIPLGQLISVILISVAHVILPLFVTQETLQLLDHVLLDLVSPLLIM